MSLEAPRADAVGVTLAAAPAANAPKSTSESVMDELASYGTNNQNSKRTALYALGSNGNHQLGIRHEKDVSVPERCYFQSPCTHSPPAHTTPLAEDAIDNARYSDYIPLQQDEHVVKLGSGGNHTLLLTSSGRVWATGLNDNGQCGFDIDSSGISTTTTTVDDSISKSSNSTNAPEQGMGIWRLLPWTGPAAEQIITDVTATFSASFFVVYFQKVYSCGSGAKGELGLGPDTINSNSVQKVFDIRDFEGEKGKIQCISGCVNHVVVLSDSGRVYGWGTGRKGQLGRDVQGRRQGVWAPQKIELGEKNIRRMATGRDFTLLLGRGPDEQILLGDGEKIGLCKDRLELSCAEHGSSDVELHAGWTHIIVRHPNSSLKGFGRNGRGQLLDAMPQSKVQKLAMGSEHALALLQHGTVIAWGWGEHGNCGTDVDEKGNVKERYNTIFVPRQGQKVTDVGAGCATSFICVEEGGEC